MLGLAGAHSSNLLFFQMNIGMFSFPIPEVIRLLFGLMTRLKQQRGIAGVLRRVEGPGDLWNG